MPGCRKGARLCHGNSIPLESSGPFTQQLSAVGEAMPKYHLLKTAEGIGLLPEEKGDGMMSRMQEQRGTQE